MPRREVGALVLGKEEEQQETIGGGMVEIDEPNAAALSAARQRPAELPEAAGARDDCPRGRRGHEMELKFTILIGRQHRVDSLGEDARLNDDHSGILRQWRTGRKRSEERLTDYEFSGDTRLGC